MASPIRPMRLGPPHPRTPRPLIMLRAFYFHVFYVMFLFHTFFIFHLFYYLFFHRHSDSSSTGHSMIAQIADQTAKPWAVLLVELFESKETARLLIPIAIQNTACLPWTSRIKCPADPHNFTEVDLCAQFSRKFRSDSDTISWCLPCICHGTAANQPAVFSSIDQ